MKACSEIAFGMARSGSLSAHVSFACICVCVCVCVCGRGSDCDGAGAAEGTVSIAPGVDLELDELVKRNAH